MSLDAMDACAALEPLDRELEEAFASLTGYQGDPTPRAKVRLPKRERPAFRLFELPAELEAIDDLLAQAESMDAADPERVELEAEITARLAVFEKALAQNGKAFHQWERKLDAEAAAAAKELARVTRAAGVAKRKHERLRSFIQTVMEALEVNRLAGPGWELRVSGNGGFAPFEWVRDEPIPLEFAKPITISPAELVKRVERLLLDAASRHAAPACTEHALLAEIVNGDPKLEVSFTTFHEALKTTGEVPDGFRVNERGKHLEVK